MWCMNRSLKISLLTLVKIVQKGECWTWTQRSIGSILTGVTFCYWNTAVFCFRIVKPLMLIFALLPILFNYEKPQMLRIGSEQAITNNACKQKIYSVLLRIEHFTLILLIYIGI